MRLQNHRLDVKFLEKLGENRGSLRPIAKRYQRIIIAVEHAMNRHLKLSSLEFLKEHMNKEAIRVLKDAEE